MRSSEPLVRVGRERSRPPRLQASDPIVSAPLRADPRQLLGRQGYRLVGQVERAPVHRMHEACIEIEECLVGVCRIHVLPAHEPTRFVGTDWEHRDIDRAEATTEFFKTVEVASVAGKVIGGVIGFQEPGAPQ